MGCDDQSPARRVAWGRARSRVPLALEPPAHDAGVLFHRLRGVADGVVVVAGSVTIEDVGEIRLLRRSRNRGESRR